MCIIRAQESNFNNLRCFVSSKIIPPYLQFKSLSNGIQPLIPLSILLCSLYIFSLASLNIDARSHNKTFRQLDARLDRGEGGGEVLLNPRIDSSVWFTILANTTS